MKYNNPYLYKIAEANTDPNRRYNKETGEWERTAPVNVQAAKPSTLKALFSAPVLKSWAYDTANFVNDAARQVAKLSPVNKLTGGLIDKGHAAISKSLQKLKPDDYVADNYSDSPWMGAFVKGFRQSPTTFHNIRNLAHLGLNKGLSYIPGIKDSSALAYSNKLLNESMIDTSRFNDKYDTHYKKLDSLSGILAQGLVEAAGNPISYLPIANGATTAGRTLLTGANAIRTAAGVGSKALAAAKFAAGTVPKAALQAAFGGSGNKAASSLMWLEFANQTGRNNTAEYGRVEDMKNAIKDPNYSMKDYYKNHSPVATAPSDHAANTLLPTVATAYEEMSDKERAQAFEQDAHDAELAAGVNQRMKTPELPAAFSRDDTGTLRGSNGEQLYLTEDGVIVNEDGTPVVDEQGNSYTLGPNGEPVLMQQSEGQQQEGQQPEQGTQQPAQEGQQPPADGATPAGTNGGNKPNPPANQNSNNAPSDPPWYEKYDTNFYNWFAGVQFDKPETWIPRLLATLFGAGITGMLTNNAGAAMMAAPVAWGLAGGVQNNWGNIKQDLGWDQQQQPQTQQ